jgi:two-component system, NtrC family, sensor histidine kinase HydH
MSPSDQYAELAELAGGFIHEIKNHISTLSLNLQLLAEDFQNPQNHHERRALERVTRLQHECQRLVDVSNDFLRFARLQELQREPTRLCELVEEMIDFFAPTAKQAGIQIHWYPAPDLPTVNLDRELFKQALLNLMINAEQAMVEGGELILQARRDGSDVLLEVIDTGSGIPAEELPKIFKPFHTTKPGGTGLGLATTRKIVLAHGGTVEVHSAVGRGTKFTIRLPATGG